MKTIPTAFMTLIFPKIWPYGASMIYTQDMVDHCRLHIAALVGRQILVGRQQGSGVRHHPDSRIGAVQSLQLHDERRLGLDGNQGLPVHLPLLIGDKPLAHGGRDCKNRESM